MTVDLGRWATARGIFASRPGVPCIAGISGGSTSGMMAALCDSSTILAFENTGKEDEKTYEFLRDLEALLERPILWLEYRPPPNIGAPPCESGFEIVNFETADRSGRPFELMMEALKNYRATKGKGPISPWWRSRICTTYMKTRLARRYIESLGWESWDELVGLRADEPNRVQRLQVGVPKYIGRRAPLSDAGITKADVNAFWDAQPIRLNLPAYRGNCGGCFLKDQADLSRALDENGDTEWWQRMATIYPGFGGKNFAGYKRLADEAPMRRDIEQLLRAGKSAVDAIPFGFDPKRFSLVVIQESKRLAGNVAPFSCACEGSDALALMDDAQENAYIENLSSEG